MNIALMQKGDSKNEFPHWSETLSALTYATDQVDGELVEFCHFKKIKEEDRYVDPLGKVQPVWTQKEFNFDTPMVVNGSIHLETSPMSYGIIPYNHFKYKIAIEHTTGYSPWDYLQMVDLANISRDKFETDAGRCHLRFLLNKKFYDRFMKVNWLGHGYEDYEKYKEIIEKSIQDGYVKVESYEPTQFWLDSVAPKQVEKSNHICLVLNWANFKKAAYVIKIAELCEKLHDYSGLDIDIKLHSYCRESYLKYLSADYIHIIPYLNTSKYDIMDKYSLFFVDSTGFGYECAYRNQRNLREVNIFYVSGLPAEEDQFRGTIYMGVNPIHDQNDFLDGCHGSSYPVDVIQETFPHTNRDPRKNIREVYDIIHRNCQEIKDKFRE